MVHASGRAHRNRKELTAELLAGPKSTRTARVLVSGILADAPGLLKIFDDNGIQIVADDVADETRQYRTDTPEMANPVDALAQKFANMDNCTPFMIRKRNVWITSLSRQRPMTQRASSF